MMQLNADAQAKSGIENYSSFSRNEGFIWMPVVHHTGKKGMYTEMRYNYEDLRTASVYIGKNFSKEAAVSYVFTPMLGVVMGNFNGGSLALKTELEYKDLFLSMESQYTVSKDGTENNFFFNWSELGYQPLKWFYTGITFQGTKSYKTKFIAEQGFFAGFVIKNFSIPVYVFNPFHPGKNFIVGVNVEW
ncbi:MAG TPA: hypothetical protein VK484_10345 [Ferruginibacter sp.]|nr:hypothetical protein [Ferruginibacter sp.]